MLRNRKCDVLNVVLFGTLWRLLFLFFLVDCKATLELAQDFDERACWPDGSGYLLILVIVPCMLLILISGILIAGCFPSTSCFETRRSMDV